MEDSQQTTMCTNDVMMMDATAAAAAVGASRTAPVTGQDMLHWPEPRASRTPRVSVHHMCQMFVLRLCGSHCLARFLARFSHQSVLGLACDDDYGLRWTSSDRRIQCNTSAESPRKTSCPESRWKQLASAPVGSAQVTLMSNRRFDGQYVLVIIMGSSRLVSGAQGIQVQGG